MTTTRTIAEIRYCTKCDEPFIYTGDTFLCRKCQELSKENK